ncbi:uncharacterized protein [Tursiops truncatus]|uniref:uncharacterized protein n=1 Tax=Tursiops truncatus TaxID=9739 RepID=UPI00095176B1
MGTTGRRPPLREPGLWAVLARGTNRTWAAVGVGGASRFCPLSARKPSAVDPGEQPADSRHGPIGAAGGVACGPARQVAVARRSLQNKRRRIALATYHFTPEPRVGASRSDPAAARYSEEKLPPGKSRTRAWGAWPADPLASRPARAPAALGARPAGGIRVLAGRAGLRRREARPGPSLECFGRGARGGSSEQGSRRGSRGLSCEEGRLAR